MKYNLVRADQGNDYNTAPPGWEQISEQEFAASSFFRFSLIHYETREITCYADGESVGERIDAKLFFTGEGEGFAMSMSRPTGGNPIVRYYRFGCKHRFERLTEQHCQERNIPHYGVGYHVRECALCKKIDVTDSRD